MLTASQSGFSGAKYQVDAAFGSLWLGFQLSGNFLFELFCLACLAKPGKLST